MLFPTGDQARKMLPVFSMITRYFPKAMREITKVCVANNVRYNPGRDPADINWARGKSPDQLGSAFRHIFERTVDDTVFEELAPELAAVVEFDRVYVLAEAAWRVCAALELDIERCERSAEEVNSAIGTIIPCGVTNGKIDSQISQCNTGQGLRPVGTSISDRGQESCEERSVASQRKRDILGEG